MSILILGGTSFVGRAITEDALRAGLDVTLFTRGLTGNDLFPGVRRLIGDRDHDDYTNIATTKSNRTDVWDAVIDVSGYIPRHIDGALNALGNRVDRYVFISAQAVYERPATAPGGDEDTPRRPPVRTITSTEDLDDDTYGPSKVACEDDVLARFGDRATIVRPGKVAGPHDPSDMFTYWVRKAARGGRIALPGDPDQPVQVIDSRDLARLVVQLVLDRRPGVFNAVGPAEPTTLAGLIHTCAEAAGTQVEVVPVDVPDDEQPPLFPLIRDDRYGQQRSAARALAAGMPATPLKVTAADVLAWDRERGLPPIARGFTDEQEQTLLAAL